MLDSRDDRLVSFRRCRSELCCDSVGLDSISSRVGGGASDSGRGSPYTFYKNRHGIHNRSVSSPVTDEFLFFFYEKFGGMCVCRFQTSVLLNHVCIVPQRSVFAVFFSCCSSSDALVRLQILLKCKDVGLLNGTPGFFLHGSFCMKNLKKKKEEEACSIHKSDVKNGEKNHPRT